MPANSHHLSSQQHNLTGKWKQRKEHLQKLSGQLANYMQQRSDLPHTRWKSKLTPELSDLHRHALAHAQTQTQNMSLFITKHDLLIILILRC